MDVLPNRLSPIAAHLARRAHLIALALFAAVGLAVFGDYGITTDEATQRKIGYASYNYIAGIQDSVTVEGRPLSDRYYGVGSELPLVVAERLLGLEDSRAIYLSRRLITHAFFLAGGFFAWLLAYRLFGSRLIALFAMLIFLLHPRLYAHSFFNTKDLPFLCMFMVSLYLIHRAFRRDSVWAFALCGAGVAALANMRLMGVMLIPAVLGMLALDGFRAMRSGGGGVKRALANSCAFSASFAAALYATWPLLWRDLTELEEPVRFMSRHPEIVPGLFRGERFHWPDIPLDYIPTWILITTPPVALALAALGIAHLARLCAADWRGMFAGAPARFGLLALACLILPAAAAIALNSNIYNGWRQMYFLYAPMSVLAAFGLSGLSALRNPRLRAAAFAAAALGIAAAFIQIAALHPYQHEYFNPLTDKSRLAERWDMDYWRISHKEALEELLKIQPSGQISLMSLGYRDVFGRDFQIFPEDEVSRFLVSPEFPAFRIVRGDGGDAVIWKREVYGAPIVSIVDARAESEIIVRETYAAARASAPSASGGGFDVYADSRNRALTYLKRQCSDDDIRAWFFLSIFPEDPADLPQASRAAGSGYESLSFELYQYGAAFDGKCAVVRDLPDYPIDRIETGQWFPELPGEDALWRAEFALPEFYERRLRQAESSGEPAIRSDFDVYMEGDSLIYAKKPCAESDTRGRFWLSVFPEDPADLPQDRRDAGFEHESLNFEFANYGAIFDGVCVAIRELPDYPIDRIETGKVTPGEGELWRGAIAVSGQ